MCIKRSRKKTFRGGLVFKDSTKQGTEGLKRVAVDMLRHQDYIIKTTDSKYTLPQKDAINNIRSKPLWS